MSQDMLCLQLLTQFWVEMMKQRRHQLGFMRKSIKSSQSTHLQQVCVRRGGKQSHQMQMRDPFLVRQLNMRDPYPKMRDSFLVRQHNRFILRQLFPHAQSQSVIENWNTHSRITEGQCTFVQKTDNLCR